MSPWEARAPLTGGRHRAVIEIEEGGSPRGLPLFLRLRGVNDSITPDDLVVFGIEPLFKENKSYNKGNCYGRNDHKQDCQLMLLASFT